MYKILMYNTCEYDTLSEIKELFQLHHNPRH